MHIGTHIDAPLHMIAGGARLSEIPVETFVGSGIIIDARGQEEISAKLLESFSIEQRSIVLVCTGHSHKFSDDSYYKNYPLFTPDFAEKAVSLGVKMVGMDTPSPDAPPFPVHKKLLGAGILIIENLTNLEQLLTVSRFNVIALPMKIHADAGPVRVIALPV